MPRNSQGIEWRTRAGLADEGVRAPLLLQGSGPRGFALVGSSNAEVPVHAGRTLTANTPSSAKTQKSCVSGSTSKVQQRNSGITSPDAGMD